MKRKKKKMKQDGDEEEEEDGDKEDDETRWQETLGMKVMMLNFWLRTMLEGNFRS